MNVYSKEMKTKFPSLKISMMIMLLGAAGVQQSLLAAVKVLTTTSDLNALVEEVGGKDVESEALCKGSQDPHFLEPKPSFMVKASRADLLVSIGMGLEAAWLPNVVRGSRNPKLNAGQPGFLEVGGSVQALELPQGKVTRAEGDVHPEGNPHITLDPIRAGEIAKVIAARLGELDSAHAALFKARADALQKRLADKTKDWNDRIVKSGVTKAVSFHKTLTYFFDRFHIQNPAILEPLPGLPPTAKHIMEVIEKVKADKIPLVMVENFFDPTVAYRVAKDAPGVRVAVVSVAVDGEPTVKSLDDLYERLVLAVEGKK